MKVNGVPEKIYLTPLEYMAASCQPQKDNTVEYTRTDTFIEKACEWLSKHFYDGCYQSGMWIDADGMIEDFEKYMKGE